MADETEVRAARRRGARSDDAHRARPGRARIPAVGLVLAQPRRRCSCGAGLAGLLDRRLVAREALGRALRNVPDDLTAATCCRAALVERLEARSTAGGRRRRVPPERPRESSRVSRCSPPISRGSPRAATRPPNSDAFRAARCSLEALRDHFFTGRERAAQAAVLQEGILRRRHRRGGGTRSCCESASRRRLPRTSNAFRRDLNAVLARGVWRLFAIARARVPPTLDAARGRRLPGRAGARARSARAMDEFTREPLPARGALPPPARRRVPGHEPRAVGARLAPRAVVGRRRRHRAGPAAAAVDLHRRRPQAVDLRVPRRGRRRAARAAGRIAELRGNREPVRRGDSQELPRRAGAARVHERAL